MLCSASLSQSLLVLILFPLSDFHASNSHFLTRCCCADSASQNLWRKLPVLITHVIIIFTQRLTHFGGNLGTVLFTVLSAACGASGRAREGQIEKMRERERRRWRGVIHNSAVLTQPRY